MAEISARAKRMWKRMTEWYGVRFTETYGTDPPEDWRKIVDKTDNNAVVRGLAIIRKRYLEHPPTLPQFEQAMAPSSTVSHEPGPADLLCKYIMKTLGSRLSEKQIRQPWDYFGTLQGEIQGVVVPADGDYRSYRVTVLEMKAPEMAA